MNEHDSEMIAGMLSELGYVQVPDRKEASIEILNTCSVRENADKRFFGTLGQLKRRSKEDPDYMVCVCGCMMQQQHIIDRIKEKYPWVDIIFGTHNIHRFPTLLGNAIREKEQKIEIWDARESGDQQLPARRLHKNKALVNIMYGCNNFCTYCIVPYTRGREMSRAPEDVLEEIEKLATDGVREVMLLGQNVNSYRGQFKNPENQQKARLEGFVEEAGICTFSHLVRLIAGIDGIERIRFMTSHPKDLSDELIETFRVTDKLCKNIHLPVQSGSDRVLKKMNRRYDSARYLDIVRKLREAVPGITMSTDIIVGFPGETEAEFEDTLEMVRKVRYDSAFTFLYSIRTGTPAATYPDQIPEDIKHERFNRLVELVDSISLEKNLAYVGRTEKVLVEGRSKRNRNTLAGRTDGFKLVNFTIDPSAFMEKGEACSFDEIAEKLTGTFMDVRITNGKTFSLEGESVL